MTPQMVGFCGCALHLRRTHTNSDQTLIDSELTQTRRTLTRDKRAGLCGVAHAIRALQPDSQNQRAGFCGVAHAIRALQEYGGRGTSQEAPGTNLGRVLRKSLHDPLSSRRFPGVHLFHLFLIHLFFCLFWSWVWPCAPRVTPRSFVSTKSRRKAAVERVWHV